MEGFGNGSSEQEGVGLLRLLSTFWGVAVLLVLGGYSIVQAVSIAPAQSTTPSVRLAALDADPPKTSFPGYVPPALLPEVAREPVVLNLACGADDVQRGSGGAGRYPITMRFDQVPDDIRAVLGGTDTVFPKDARINMSPCIRGMLERGELP